MELNCFAVYDGELKRFKVRGDIGRLTKTKSMEIKIKDQDKLINATLEVVDGVMIVTAAYIEDKWKEHTVKFKEEQE